MGSETRAEAPYVDPLGNHLLAALSDREFNRIAPGLEPVNLARPTELEEANEQIEFVYFPTSGWRKRPSG